ncbi:MAG: hypothetical protein JRC86_13225 [Deltaproteobacteria bacterium]|nr:hypothetical protein [Deltaproteobacteria bacterium]
MSEIKVGDVFVSKDHRKNLPNITIVAVHKERVAIMKNDELGSMLTSRLVKSHINKTGGVRKTLDVVKGAAKREAKTLLKVGAKYTQVSRGTHQGSVYTLVHVGHNKVCVERAGYLELEMKYDFFTRFERALTDLEKVQKAFPKCKVREDEHYGLYQIFHSEEAWEVLSFEIEVTCLSTTIEERIADFKASIAKDIEELQNYL